jgi:hypothetical protein
MMKSYPEYASMIHQGAQKLAGKGKQSFPCKANKAPCTPRGFKDASADPEQVKALFTKYRAENIGMPTGSRSDVFVLDVDRLEALGELPKELPETLTIRTPSGGLHYYFNHVEGVSNKTGNLPVGIDIRGDGGYVIVPPSKGYTVERRAPVADAPDWLLEALRDEPRKPSGPARSQSQTCIPDDGEPIHEGTRDRVLASICGRLHDGTRDEGELEAALQVVNETRCIPPLPSEQVRKIALSIYRYEPCRPARREPDAETIAALEAIESALLSSEYRGQGGKTTYSICVALLKLARQHGELVEDGVRLQVSVRQLALAAAVSRRTIANKLKAMTEILRHETEGTESGKSGAVVLLLPRATLHHSNHRASYRGGCAKWRAPLTAPRLRWSSPAYRPRRGVTPGTSRVRQGVAPEKVAAVIRLGKSCERVMDRLEAAGGSMMLPDLADAVDVKRPRDLTRRKNLETGKGRDGFVTRLQDVGVLTVDEDTVSLCEDWLEALNRERVESGEFALYKRDMRRYNEQSRAYRNRHKVKADPAPSEEEMREARESFSARRREAIEAAIAQLFREHPEYRGKRVGQITCQLMFYLPDDFLRGSIGAPKDAEVEAILDGVAA